MFDFGIVRVDRDGKHSYRVWVREKLTVSVFSALFDSRDGRILARYY